MIEENYKRVQQLAGKVKEKQYKTMLFFFQLLFQRSGSSSEFQLQSVHYGCTGEEWNGSSAIASAWRRSHVEVRQHFIWRRILY